MALDRLIPIEMLPLAQLSEDQSIRILINERGRERAATVTAQSADGKVYLRYDDTEEEQCVDLASMKYEWL